jgi:hypothetical protein
LQQDFRKNHSLYRSFGELVHGRPGRHENQRLVIPVDINVNLCCNYFLISH